jgi:HSP20 family molecular chaperone IbpA
MGRLYPFKAGKGFRRTLQLPREVDPSRVEAKYEAGLLMVKAAVAAPRGVKVSVE